MSSQRYRVTGAGVLFGIALTLSGAAAFLTGNNLLFLVFSAMLALLLVSGFLNRLILSGLELELLLPRHVSARTPAQARIRLRNTKYLTPSFSVDLTSREGGASLIRPVYFPLIPGRRSVEAAVEMTFPTRGRYRESVLVLSSGFPFGFIRRTTCVPLQRETIVYPAISGLEGRRQAEDLAEAEAGAAQRGEGLDLYRIRPYLMTDSARLVDWKNTAHTGELQVREFTRHSRRTAEIYLDRYVPRDRLQRFEQILDDCASLVWRMDELAYDLRFRSDDYEECETFAILRYLAVVEPAAASNDVQNESSTIVFRVER